MLHPSIVFHHHSLDLVWNHGGLKVASRKLRNGFQRGPLRHNEKLYSGLYNASEYGGIDKAFNLPKGRERLVDQVRFVRLSSFAARQAAPFTLMHWPRTPCCTLHLPCLTYRFRRA